jgi:hypothetical protein
VTVRKQLRVSLARFPRPSPRPSDAAAAQLEPNVDSTSTGHQGPGLGARLRGTPSLGGERREMGAGGDSSILAGKPVEPAVEPAVGPVARASDSSNVTSPLAGADAPIRKPVAKDGVPLAGKLLNQLLGPWRGPVIAATWRHLLPAQTRPSGSRWPKTVVPWRGLLAATGPCRLKALIITAAVFCEGRCAGARTDA